MKRKTRNSQTLVEKIKSADPNAVMRFMASALLLSAVVAVLLFVNSNGENRYLGRKMFCQVNTVLAEGLERYFSDTEDGEALDCKEVLTTDAFEGKLTHILYEVRSGNILYNSATDEGFAVTHIGFLKNYSFASGYSDIKLFSDIDDKNNGYTEILTEKGRYSVCYAPLNDGQMYLFSVLPYKQLYLARSGSAVAFVSVVVLLAFAGAVCVVLSFRATLRTKNDGAYARGRYSFLEKILHRLSDEDVNAFVYTKHNDSLESVGKDNDVFSLDGGAMEYITNGFDENDARKIRNAIALAGSEKELSVNVEKCGKKYRYTFSSEKKADGETAVLCTSKRIYDDTDETDGELSSSTFDDESYKTTCIEVFLERNMWHFLWNNEKCFDNTGYVSQMQNDYDTQLERVIAPYVCKNDRDSFARLLNRHYLLECFRNGTFEMNLVYRIEDASAELRCRRLDVRIYRDKYNDEIKANFYVRNVSGNA